MTVRCRALGWLGMLGFWAASVASGKEPEKPAEPVDLFAAWEAGDIDVTVIPENAKRLTVQVANQRDRPLAIRLPDAVAAVPVLAQRGLPGLGPALGPGFPQGQPNAGNPAAQGLGAPWGQSAQNNNQFRGNQFPGGLLNVPPGKIVKQRLPCVCLDFGKPTPRPQMPYKLERFENVQDQPAVREVVQTLGRAGYSHEVVQLVTWHLANGLSWEKLAALKHERANGRTVPRYTQTELAQARKLLEQLPSKQPASPGEASSQSVSQR